MKKIGRFSEASWVLGVVIISFAVALITKAGFGVSMVVAPAYGIHLFVSQYLPWYSFGTSEYIFQGTLLILMCIIIRKFNWRYLLSFFTSVIYGVLIDFWLFVLGGSGVYHSLGLRIIALAVGMVLTSLAVAFFFRTYFPLQVYELFVTQVSAEFKMTTEKFKYIYDFSSCVFACILALIFSLLSDSIKFTDCIGIGTVACTVFNAFLIKLFGLLLDKLFEFNAAFPKLKRIIAAE